MSQLFARFVKRYPRGPTIRADIEQPADRFSIVVLFGPSGCGKTTILRCLAGLDRPDEGTIVFGGRTWFSTAGGQFQTPQQRGVGLLFQDYALFPHKTVAQNIGYAIRGPSVKERSRRVAELMASFDLTGLDDRRPSQISGGQQQRVALARAMAARPRLLLLDEPLSALDAGTRIVVRRELRGALASFGIPVIVVTHDAEDVSIFGDKVIAMDAPATGGP